MKTRQEKIQKLVQKYSANLSDMHWALRYTMIAAYEKHISNYSNKKLSTLAA